MKVVVRDTLDNRYTFEGDKVSYIVDEDRHIVVIQDDIVVGFFPAVLSVYECPDGVRVKG